VKVDFALILTVLSAVTGIVWLLDRLFFAKRRAHGQEGERPPSRRSSTIPVPLFPVLLFVLVLRSFVAEPFRIPSESMMPNLLVGDFILVNKFNYGLPRRWPTRSSWSWVSPSAGTWWFSVIPAQRRRSGEGSRLHQAGIGLPGDVIDVRDDQVTITASR
jgi:signal peptidase I